MLFNQISEKMLMYWWINNSKTEDLEPRENEDHGRAFLILLFLIQRYIS